MDVMHSTPQDKRLSSNACIVMADMDGGRDLDEQEPLMLVDSCVCCLCGMIAKCYIT
jgi:hypothetical protein